MTPDATDCSGWGAGEVFVDASLLADSSYAATDPNWEVDTSQLSSGSTRSA